VVDAGDGVDAARARHRNTTSSTQAQGATVRTQVGIVGAGPAGLMLSHLLHQRGVESVVIDLQTRETIEQTIKAGILEQGTVDLMRQTGVGDPMMRDGFVHQGINLAFRGGMHRIDLTELSGGRSVTVYAQHEVLKDLIARRMEDGGDIRFGVTDTRVADLTTEQPRITFTHEGRQESLECDFVIGADGSRTYPVPHPRGRGPEGLLPAVPVRLVRHPGRAPPSSDELIHAHSDRGFVLVSTRSPSVQRLYFQCDPETKVEDWSDDRIWAEFEARLAPAGVSLKTGNVFRKDVLKFRSFVCEPMQYGRLFLAGDAAHAVPPTARRGSTSRWPTYTCSTARSAPTTYRTKDTGLLESYTQTALRRVWRAQWFSFWMTSMLHRFSDATDFDLRRQVAELELVTSSPTAAKTLADNYVGQPLS
jgi:p-hydroxybenzoate 3-monooxygenase